MDKVIRGVIRGVIYTILLAPITHAVLSAIWEEYLLSTGQLERATTTEAYESSSSFVYGGDWTQ